MSTAAQANSAARSQPKVLRLGLMKDGTVSERITKIGEVVTVGENPRNLFVIHGTDAGQKLDLFIPQRDGYLLQVPESMTGMIQTRDGMKSLVDLRATATKKGELWVYLIDERVRGKLVLGKSGGETPMDISVLFQLVPAPPQPERALTPADFRPKWWDDEDPLFLMLLGSFSVVACAFMAWIYVTPRPDDADLTNIEDAIRLLDKDIEPLPIPVEEVVAEGEEPAEEDKPKEPAESEKPASPSPNDKKPSSESVTQKSILLQTLASFGEGQGTASSVLGDDAAAMQGLDAALAGVSGAQEATAEGLAAKSGGQGGRGDATVGVSTAGGGQASAGGAAAVKVKKPKVDYGSADADVESGDGGSIASVVKKKSGTFQGCTEAGLKQDENMKGRITIGWSITNGKVGNVQLIDNSTGNAAIGTCFTTAVRSLRFDEGLTAEVSAYSWSVSGQ